MAFPGAVGFGKNVTGGRGGTVYHVTNLNDTGAGSFRDAVSASNRIIVFDVSGYIQLKSAVSAKGNITIAGQTAPGEGIALRGGKLSFGKQSNIIIRHLRVRPGSEVASKEDVGINLVDAHDVIIDHCSVEFAPWNNIGGVSTNSSVTPVNNVTFQNCLIANPTYQQFGAHIESPNANWTWAYNIFANSHNRNPLDKVNDIFVNNVLYNVSAGYTTHTSTNFKHDIINNYFVMGPASTGTDNQWYQVDKNQSIYYSGNLKDKNYDGILNGSATTPYWYQGTGTVLSAPWSTETKNIPTYSAATAFRYTSSFAGTFPYDEMDRLVISQVRTVGKGTTGYGVGTAGPNSGLYTSQTQTGLGNNGYGTIATGTKPTDTDGDGMPDFWEKTFGLNQSANDAMTKGSDGYAYIEKYINWLADVHAQTLQNTTLTFDMTTHTAGFAAVSPTYMVSAATNGTVTLSADGKKAVFVPTSGFYGMASFKFTVTGSDGTAYTYTVNVLVEKDNTVIVKDCNGVAGGSAYLDDCSICVGGTTGKTACVKDCNGTANGTAVLDNCGVCVGGTTGLTACTDALQAEDFCSADGVLEATNTGFQSDGYLNLNNAVGSTSTYYVISSKAQTAKIGIRYANGGTVARGYDVLVNGTKQVSATGTVTGAWTTWKVESVNLTLVSGINKIQLSSLTADGAPNIDEFVLYSSSVTAGSCTADCNGTISGSAYVDACNVCVGGTTGKVACVKDCNGDVNGSAYLDTCGVCVGGKSPYLPCNASLEAETACSVDGIASETKNSGFSGAGYVNSNNSVGSYASWVLNSVKDQSITLTFRYANGGTASRNGLLKINGTFVDTLRLPQTEGWDSWIVTSMNVNLKQGSNEILVTAVTADGLANLDVLYFSTGISNANCLVTGMEKVQMSNQTYVYPNPFTNSLHIYKNGEFDFEILDQSGRICKAGKAENSILVTHELISGVYILKLQTASHTEFIKLVKE
ncbi:MAG: carbohydrate-binding protein [Cytophagales bacterium]